MPEVEARARADKAREDTPPIQPPRLSRNTTAVTPSAQRADIRLQHIQDEEGGQNAGEYTTSSLDIGPLPIDAPQMITIGRAETFEELMELSTAPGSKYKMPALVTSLLETHTPIGHLCVDMDFVSRIHSVLLLTRSESSASFSLQDCNDHDKKYRTQIIRGEETHTVCGGSANGVGVMKPLNLQHQDVLHLVPRKHIPGAQGKKGTTEDCFQLRFSFDLSENLLAEMQEAARVAAEEAAARLAAEARKAAEETDARLAVEETARVAAEEQTARFAADEAARKAAEKKDSQAYCIRGVLENKYVGRVMGSRQSTLGDIEKTTNSEIVFTDYSSYHPAASQRQGRVFTVTGPSKSQTADAMRAVISGACSSFKTADNIHRAGLDLEQDGLELVVPDVRASTMLGVGGGGLDALKNECGLTSLSFNHRDAKAHGERLLRARGGFDGIVALCNQVLGILGPAPCGYGPSIQYDRKRKQPEADAPAQAGHGNQIRGSEQAERHQRNVGNKKQKQQSKKEKHEARQVRDAKAKQEKADFKRWIAAGKPSGTGGNTGTGGHGGSRGRGGGGGGSSSGQEGTTLQCQQCPKKFIYTDRQRADFEAKTPPWPQPKRCNDCIQTRKSKEEGSGGRGRGGRGRGGQGRGGRGRWGGLG